MTALTEALAYVDCRGWMDLSGPARNQAPYKSARYSGGRIRGMSGDPMEIESNFQR